MLRKILRKWFWKEYVFSVKIRHFYSESRFYVIEYIVPGYYFFLFTPQWKTLKKYSHNEFDTVLLYYDEAKKFAQKLKTFDDVEKYYEEQFGKVSPKEEIII